MSGDRSPAVQFDTDLRPAVNSAATVDVSTDGGRTWASVWRNRGFPGDPGPATVASVTDPTDSTHTFATPGDDALGGGLYALFVTATGPQQFTASAAGFAAATQSATITSGKVTALNFSLAANTAGAAAPVPPRPGG